jgi:DinB family protein
VSETPQQYIQRMMAQLGGLKPLNVQAETAAKLGRLLGRASGGKLRKRPAPGKWAAAEILAHLADCEIVTGWRMRQILGAPGTPIQAFDQDAWAAAGHYEKRDAHKSLEQFRAAREGNLVLLKSLTPEQWKHHGMHAERGVETIEHIVCMMAGHDLNHLAQVERIVAPKKVKKN